MYKNKRILGIIPARGGSVGVPKKNIRLLDGQPLLTHTVKEAAKVKELDLVVLSTDCNDIASVGQNLNLHIINRPAELATADAKTESALLHALDVLKNEFVFDYLVVLEPTSPFRKAETISRCIQTIINSEGDSLVTLCKTTASFGTLTNGQFRLLNPDAPRRRQDRQPLHYESSTVYACSVEHLRKTKSLVSEIWLGVEVSEQEAFDINTMYDFYIAEAILAQEKSINDKTG